MIASVAIQHFLVQKCVWAAVKLFNLGRILTLTGGTFSFEAPNWAYDFIYQPIVKLPGCSLHI